MIAEAVDIPLPNGLTLRGLAWGAPSAPLVIALHGWLDNAASFTEIAHRLVPDYRVLALDLVGHGWSDHRPAGCRYHLLDNIDDVLLAIEHLGPAQFHLLGHSLGASIAAYVAALQPQGLVSLVCLEGLGSLTMQDSEARQLLHDGVRAHRQSLQRLQRDIPAPFAEPDDAVMLRTQGLFPLSTSAARHLTLRALRQVPGGWFWRTDPRLKAASTYRLTEAIVVNYLQGIRVPTLLVGADAGYFGRGELLTQRAQQVADIAIVALPGGHHFHLEVDTAPAVGAVTADFFAKQLAKQLT